MVMGGIVGIDGGRGVGLLNVDLEAGWDGDGDMRDWLLLDVDLGSGRGKVMIGRCFFLLDMDTVVETQLGNVAFDSRCCPFTMLSKQHS